MRRPEDFSAMTPQERFFWDREYFQTEINRGTMGGARTFHRLFSEGRDLTELTHVELDKAGREMNQHWIGNTRNKDRR